jgi:hypothetical protein
VARRPAGRSVQEPPTENCGTAFDVPPRGSLAGRERLSFLAPPWTGARQAIRHRVADPGGGTPFGVLRYPLRNSGQPPWHTPPPPKRTKSLSATHETDVSGAVLKVVADVAIAEVHVPRVVQLESIRGRRPKPIAWGIRKEAGVDRGVIATPLDQGFQLVLVRQAPIRLAGKGGVRRPLQRLRPGEGRGPSGQTAGPAQALGALLPYQARGGVADGAIAIVGKRLSGALDRGSLRQVWAAPTAPAADSKRTAATVQNRCFMTPSLRRSRLLPGPRANPGLCRLGMYPA